MRKLFVLASILVSALSHADIINCSVSVQNDFIGKVEHMDISIYIPPAQKLIVGLYDSDSTEFDSFVSIDEVTKGTLQFTYKSGNKKEHELIVTRMPGGGNSLVGYYINQGYITSVKVDLWEDTKPIYMHDTGLLADKIMVGNCK
ncbi:hypothetical protein HJ124_22985 [Vibrio parahaemolyticus]|nr:hypothetical protein [Vibrio parahaemolyticus]